MNIEDAYLKFLEKVNQNNTNDNMSADRGRFISIFNEEQNKYVEWVIEKRNEVSIHYIQKLLVKDKPLDYRNKVANHQDFLLPKDLFSFVNVQCFASSGSCTRQPMLLFEAKSENVHELLADENNKPSFEFRETFYTLGTDSVNIYVDDFTIDTLLLSYYRYPRRVDISGYIDSEGKPTIDINPEFDDKIVDRILTACAKSFNANNNGGQIYQVDRDRIYSKI